MWHVTNLLVTFPDARLKRCRQANYWLTGRRKYIKEGRREYYCDRFTAWTNSRRAAPRADLLTQAREFLSSPAIVSRKRKFVHKKALSPEQTEKLLEEADVRQSRLVRSLGLMAAGAAPTAGSSSNISTTAAAFTASRTSCLPCENNRDFGRCVRSRALDLSCMFDTWTMGFTFPAELTFSNFTWIVLNISSFVGFVCRATRFEKASS